MNKIPAWWFHVPQSQRISQSTYRSYSQIWCARDLFKGAISVIVDNDVFLPRNPQRGIHDFLRSFTLNVYAIGGNDFEISRNFIEAFLFTRSAKSAVRDTWTISPAAKLSFCRSADRKYRKSRGRGGKKSEWVKKEGNRGESCVGETEERRNYWRMVNCRF